MRKKSHIILARYIADQMEEAEELQSHRKAFCLGSILPDMKPSFLTTKHEFNGTFQNVRSQMEALASEWNSIERNARIFWRRLGEVIHYIADYFTFPHNDNYEGTLLQHGKYEKHLKNALKEYIQTGKAEVYAQSRIEFKNVHDICQFIEENHKRYIEQRRNLKDDMEFILTICYQVVQGLFQILCSPYGQRSEGAMVL